MNPLPTHAKKIVAVASLLGNFPGAGGQTGGGGVVLCGIGHPSPSHAASHCSPTIGAGKEGVWSTSMASVSSSMYDSSEPASSLSPSDTMRARGFSETKGHVDSTIGLPLVRLRGDHIDTGCVRRGAYIINKLRHHRADGDDSNTIEGRKQNHHMTVNMYHVAVVTAAAAAGGACSVILHWHRCIVNPLPDINPGLYIWAPRPRTRKGGFISGHIR